MEIDKKILEQWNDIATYKLFFHMLIKANLKDEKFNGFEISAGSFMSSILRLSEETKLNVSDVREAIKKLKSRGEITSITYDKFTIFSIENYSAYQNKIENKLCECMEKKDFILEKSEVIANQNLEKTENKHVCNNEIKCIQKFEDFWKVYPRKNAKTLSEQAYIQLLLTTEWVTEEQIVQAANNYAEYCKILEVEEVYIFKPHNWINKSAWIDYLPGNYKKPEKKRKGTGFNNFEQRDYDFDELEKQILKSQEITQEV